MLRLLDATEAECFLSEAIAWAHPAELPRLAAFALQASRAGAQIALLQRMIESGTDVPWAIVDSPGSIAPAAAVVVAQRGESSLLGVLLTIIARRGDLSAMREVLPLLRFSGDVSAPGTASGADPMRPASTRVSRCLLGGCVRLLGRTGRRLLSEDQRSAVDDLLLEIAEAWLGRRDPVLLLLLAHGVECAGEGVRRVLEDEGTELAAAMRGVSRLVDQPLVSSNIVRWLGTDSRGRSAVRRLPDHLVGPDPARVLGDGHLLRVPRRRVLLRKLDRPGVVLDRLLALGANLPLRARLALPVLISGTGLSVAGRLARLHQLEQCDASPLVRLRAGEAMTLLRGETSGVSQAALARGGAEGPMAAAHDAGGMPDGSLNDLGAFSTCLRSSPPAEIIGAIARVRRRRLVPFVEPLLLEAAHALDARVASAAIAALPEGRSAQRVNVIHEAMSHDDPRVAANAVEAAGRLRRVDRAVCRFANAPHNRLRANAVRAMLGGGLPGAELELKRMLEDPHPLHRISAIWVTRVERAAGVLDVLDEVVRTEPVATVRVRAQAAQRFLHAAVRHRAPVRRRGHAYGGVIIDAGRTHDR